MNEDLLRTSLSAAVPLWIEELRHLPEEARMRLGRECAQVIAEKGDVIQFKSKKAGETAAAFNALAKGLACLAYVPGGVTFLGVHFEAAPARPPEPPARADALDPTPPHRTLRRRFSLRGP